jgi:hypothetical protein
MSATPGAWHVTTNGFLMSAAGMHHSPCVCVCACVRVRVSVRARGCAHTHARQRKTHARTHTQTHTRTPNRSVGLADHGLVVGHDGEHLTCTRGCIIMNHAACGARVWTLLFSMQRASRARLHCYTSRNTRHARGCIITHRATHATREGFRPVPAYHSIIIGTMQREKMRSEGVRRCAPSRGKRAGSQTQPAHFWQYNIKCAGTWKLCCVTCAACYNGCTRNSA